ncbi:MAG: YtxH domain-containing protein [Candidatus Pacebacteria bacterium]|nr:YtxH domain-containing protein [Candidatus Paceibacterota bacterium]
MEHHKKSTMVAFASGAVVAALVGGYFLFGSKNARKNRQKIQDGVDDAKSEVLDKVKKMKRLSRDMYYEIVDEISDKYSKVKEFGVEKADDLRTELKNRWNEVEEKSTVEGGK